MKTRHKVEDVSESDLEVFEMPETVLCVDTMCNICYAEFLDEEDLKLHIKQVHLTEKNSSRYCELCSSIFTSLEDYAAHICEVHILTLKCCRYCMRAFSHVPEVTRHEKKHLSASYRGSFSCSNCSFTFKSISELEHHEYEEHGDSKDGVMLQGCYSLLSSFLNMKAQTFLQSLGRNHVYTCTRCKFTTPNVEYYMQHLKKKNCRSLVCDKCCNVYNNFKSMNRHFTLHKECHNKVDSNLQKKCHKCNKLFNYDELRQHIKECVAVKCASCDVIFDTIEEKTEHQVKFHQTMFSIKICKYCHREFVGQVALDKHIERSHKKDLHLYKYFCVYCDDIFNHPKKLFSHFSSKHKDLKPFTCKICDKTFRLRKQFTLHIKLDHTSVGTVKFDENFHVFFTEEEPNPPSEVTQEMQINNENENSAQSDIEADPLTTACTNNEYVNENTQPLLIPMKKRFVNRSHNDVDLVMCPTETEADQTDSDMNKITKQPVKRKRKTKTKETSTCFDLTLEDNSDEFSDNEPLIQFKKRVKTKEGQKKSLLNFNKSKELRKNRHKFTCKICKKYCYTFQNFNHHMSLHQTHENKKCIKCPKVFKSKVKLNAHIIKEHSSSKLTETLKTVLERRKNSQNKPQVNQTIDISTESMSEKFSKTIKRVNVEKHITAVVTPVNNKLSVKKFIENFTPDATEANIDKVEINNSLTIKSVNTPVKPPLIKLMKFKPEEPPMFIKLKPPERFKESISEPYNVSIKLVQKPLAKPKMNFDAPQEEYEPVVENHYEELTMEDSYNDINDDTNETAIPDVAQEVLLEGTDETSKPKNVTHRIVLPNLPKEYKDVHIAHLLPEAPYYKIVKIKDVLKDIKKETEPESETHDIKLPDGTKLISVNPLAHLLGDKQLELPKNKYYKPKPVDFEKAVAKALLNSTKATTRKSKKKIKVEAEQ
ncbi:unnamed protein product [Parnassius mnemosyne]|uniref:C2H2-type domain-containing protein n=1 Tax=Parnassius mnemosyne TaxID=213953 RepID=A0AAV1LAZ6_9NEOP